MHGSTTVTDYLAGDHRRLDSLLAGARAATRASDWPELEVELRGFIDGLRRHIRLEEEIVFPVFAKRTGIVGPLRVMEEEHRVLEGLLAQILAATSRTDGLALNELMQRLSDLIVVHNAKEERVLYPKTDQALTPTERAALATRLEQA
jgi:iron-sulfur cluster repair protein YtfE (RIC family)